jgi:DNA-binding response OmpR family regulator
MVRILIIEDDKSISELLKEALTQESYAVDTAFTGEDARWFHTMLLCWIFYCQGKMA